MKTLVTANDRRNLETLLRLAAAEADNLRADLADMAKARLSASRALAAIGDEAAAEGPAAERREGRRRGLMMTLDILGRAQERTESRMRSMRGEVARLKSLMQANALASLAASGPDHADDGILRRAS